MDRIEMPKRFITIIVCLSLSPLISEASESRCQIDPVKSVAIVDDRSHLLTCLAKMGSMIIGWKLGPYPPNGSAPEVYNANDTSYFTNLTSLGVIGTIESKEIEFVGYTTGHWSQFRSLRKFTEKVDVVAMDSVRDHFCVCIEIVSKTIFFCKADIVVIAKRPSFASSAIDVSKGIFANLNCDIQFFGIATLRLRITDSDAAVRNQTVAYYPDFGWHNISLTYVFKGYIAKHGDHYSISTDAEIDTAFHCAVMIPEYHYRYIGNVIVDAPVTYATIHAYNATRCSAKTCFMHEKLVCRSKGRPAPTQFEWRVSVNYGNFRNMLYQTSEQFTQESGRNTYQCKVFNVVNNYNFSAGGRFTTHVLAYYWRLDENSTYISRGWCKHKVWFPMTMVAPAAAAAIIWVFWRF